MLMRTLRRAAVMIVAAAGLTVVSAAPAHAFLDVYYPLVNEYTHQCLEVNSPALGTALQQWPCWGGDNQRWTWKNFATPGDPHLRNLTSPGCVANAGQAGLVLADCTYPTTLGQWFTQVDVGGGQWELRTVTGQYCFQAPNTYNGARIVVAPCNGSAAQRWRTR